MARSKYSPTGARRSGDDYQDVVALDILVQWLEHPDRFQRILVEADDVGWLDDVVALKSNGSVVAKQVKFSTHPEAAADPWEWEDLLREKESRPGTSLLARWARSLETLRRQYGTVRACLTTNRKAAEGILRVLSPVGLVDFDKISEPELRREITEQLSGEDNARLFFSQFRFEFDQPGLDVLEEDVRARFHRLRGTGEGWLSLKDELRSWVGRRGKPTPDGAITLPDIRKAAQWHQLKSMPEEFEVPADFVLPPKGFHSNFLDDLLQRKCGCLVLAAGPGLGKSTYLSHVCGILDKDNVPVVRHHYFLSLTDRTPGRADHECVAESLMNDMRARWPEALGPLRARNPNPRELHKCVEAYGKHFSQQEKTLVIVLDGLDHVWRTQDSITELERLLEHLLPTPAGVVLLIGMQPLEDRLIPPSLLQAAPRGEWTALPGFDRSAVAEWVQRHVVELRLPDEPRQGDAVFRALGEAFFKKSEGNPLHLHYSLKALLKIGEPVTVAGIEKLPACPDQDIDEYYALLWRALDDGAREVLHLIAACEWPWPSDGLIACLDPQRNNPSIVAGALGCVRHLLEQDALGIRPFHSSLLVHIRNTQEHTDCSRPLKEKALAWLRTQAPEYWRWAHSWRLAEELGDPKPLLTGPSRQWVLEAVGKRYPHGETKTVLARSAHRALQNRDLPRWVEVGLLREYFQRASESQTEILSNLLYAQLKLMADPHLAVRLLTQCRSLSDGELFLLAESCAEDGDQDGVRLCLKELEESAKRHRTLSSTEFDSATSSRVADLFSVAALDERLSRVKVLEAIRAVGEREGSCAALEAYARSLRTARRIPALREMLGSLSSPEEVSVVAQHAALLALQEGIDIEGELHPALEAGDPWAMIYFAFRQRTSEKPGNIQIPEPDLLRLDESYQYSHRTAIQDLLHKLFFAFLGNHLWDRSEQNSSWLGMLSGDKWPCRFVRKLNEIVGDLAPLLAQRSPPAFCWLHELVDSLRWPSWPEDREVFHYAQYAAQAVARISLDYLVVTKAAGGTGRIALSDIQAVFNCKYCDTWHWMDEYVDRRETVLTLEATKWALEDCEVRLSEGIEAFPERARCFCTLASVAALHGLDDEAHSCVRKTAENLIAYGDHKDILLSQTMDLLQICHDHDMKESRKWLLLLAPAIAEVSQFTDGKETNHLPKELGRLLSGTAPELVPAYHSWLCEKEDYEDALGTFHALLRTADLQDTFARVLAETGIDDESLAILHERADRGNKGAEQALASLRSLLGRIPIPGHEATSSEEATLGERSRQPPETPSPEEYPPEKFKEYVRAGRDISFLSRRGVVRQWLDRWRNAGRWEDAVAAVTESGMRALDPDDYDALYEHTLGLYGGNRAFDALVEGQRALYGWNTYYIDKKYAVKRWALVKDNHADRWFDFIQFTLPEQGDWPTAFVQFVRLSEYCLLMGKREIARDIAQRVIDTALELVSPLNLQEPAWLTSQPVSGSDRYLEILMSRLTWPSVFVRERACTALARLLLSTDRPTVQRRLLQWIKAQQLESVSAIGALVLMRAQLLDAGFEIPVTESILPALQRPSILSWLILNELLPGPQPAPDWADLNSGTAPDTHKPDAFFVKHCCHFLPPAYLEGAKELEQSKGIAFVTQWAFEWQRILDLTGEKPASDVLHFKGREESDNYATTDFRLSEVYRSAFLRALAWGISKHALAAEEAATLVVGLGFVDLGLWRIEPSTKPTWWPTATAPEGDIDTVPSQIWEQVQSLWEEQSHREDDWILTMASGRVYEKDVIYDLDICGLYQRCHGPAEPDLADVMGWCVERICLVSAPGFVFQGVLALADPGRLSQSFDDWSVVPTALRLWPFAFPRWQFWRVQRGIWLPVPLFGPEPIKYRCSDDAVVAEQEGVPIGRWTDWADGLREKRRANLPPATGQCLLVNRPKIVHFIEETRSAFCWVCRVTGYHRSWSHEAFKHFTQHRVYGAQSVIVP